MGKEIFRPVAKTLIVLVAIGMFSCKSPMKENIHGANMGNETKKAVPVKIEQKDAETATTKEVTEKKAAEKPKLFDAPEKLPWDRPLDIKLKETPPKKFKVHE